MNSFYNISCHGKNAGGQENYNFCPASLQNPKIFLISCHLLLFTIPSSYTKSQLGADERSNYSQIYSNYTNYKSGREKAVQSENEVARKQCWKGLKKSFPWLRQSNQFGSKKPIALSLCGKAKISTALIRLLQSHSWLRSQLSMS